MVSDNLPRYRACRSQAYFAADAGCIAVNSPTVAVFRVRRPGVGRLGELLLSGLHLLAVTACGLRLPVPSCRLSGSACFVVPCVRRMGCWERGAQRLAHPIQCVQGGPPTRPPLRVVLGAGRCGLCPRAVELFSFTLGGANTCGLGQAHPRSLRSRLCRVRRVSPTRARTTRDLAIASQLGFGTWRVAYPRLAALAPSIQCHHGPRSACLQAVFGERTGCRDGLRRIPASQGCC